MTAHNELLDVFTWCKTHKDELLAARAEGNSLARNIISTHDMYVRHPEGIALTLLECFVEDWKKQETQP